MEGELPDDPEKLKQYIDRLHDRIEFLEKELQDSQRDLLVSRDERNKEKELNDEMLAGSIDILNKASEIEEKLEDALSGESGNPDK